VTLGIIGVVVFWVLTFILGEVAFGYCCDDWRDKFQNTLMGLLVWVVLGLLVVISTEVYRLVRYIF